MANRQTFRVYRAYAEPKITIVENKSHDKEIPVMPLSGREKGHLPTFGETLRELDKSNKPSYLSLPTFMRKNDTKADAKVIEEMELLIKKEIIKLMKEKSQIISKQNSALKSVSLKVPAADCSEERIKKLSKMGDLGLRLVEINLGLERRYESIFTSFDSIVTELQSYLDRFLNTQKKELFSALVVEENQNRSNFQVLENKLYEIFQKGGERFDINEKTFSAFTEMLAFTREFRDDFYSLISSRLAPISLKDLKNDFSKNLLAKFSSLTVAPKAFPSELLRFFEQKKYFSSQIDERTLCHGTKVVIEDEFPEGMNIDRCLYQIPLHLMHNVRDRENPRTFSLLGWLDKSSLIVASNCQIKIFGMNLGSMTHTKRELRRLTQESQLQYDSGRVFEDKYQIQCMESIKYEGHSYLLLGCNHSVDFSELDGESTKRHENWFSYQRNQRTLQSQFGIRFKCQKPESDNNQPVWSDLHGTSYNVFRIYGHTQPGEIRGPTGPESSQR